MPHQLPRGSVPALPQPGHADPVLCIPQPSQPVPPAAGGSAFPTEPTSPCYPLSLSLSDGTGSVKGAVWEQLWEQIPPVCRRLCPCSAGTLEQEQLQEHWVHCAGVGGDECWIEAGRGCVPSQD